MRLNTFLVLVIRTLLITNNYSYELKNARINKSFFIFLPVTDNAFYYLL